MSSRPLKPPTGGAFDRRFTRFSGIFFDQFKENSAWIRERAAIQFPPMAAATAIVVHGESHCHPEARGLELTAPGVRLELNGIRAGEILPGTTGPWSLPVTLPPNEISELTLALTGTGFTNFLAWLGRLTGLGCWQRFRAQNKNRQLRVTAITSADHEPIYDFSRRDAPYATAFARRHTRLGLNIAGFLTADLGVGESARCMVRAADAAQLPTALIALKLNCKNRLGDATYATRLQDENPHGVNVVHLDPPASRDLDHHHGPTFRAGKYTIAYFAWELPEFPDAWVPNFEYYDEIWCPSDFTASAVALKSPVPVITMPHAIGFTPPTGTATALRQRFALPIEKFLFLTLFDLNSYAARKNPRAVIDAFRLSGLAGHHAALVIKVQNVTGNEADFAALQAAVADLPGTVLLTTTFARADIYALEAACDCFVSLHRSEGFGLAVAECMYLGKPVISTNWSATAEFVSHENGCPVRAPLIALDRNYGPYAKGSFWADPDPAHAAEWMHTLFTNRTLAAQLGTAAQATIRTRFAPAVIGARYRQRLESISTF